MTLSKRLSVLLFIGVACCARLTAAQPDVAQADGVSQELEQQIADYLEEVGRIMRDNDIEAMDELIDVAGILDYAYAQEAIPPVFEDAAAVLTVMMKPDVGAIFAEPGSGYAFSAFRIWRIIEKDGVYVVSASQTDEAGYIQRARWWLRPNPETGFLICDVELVDAAMRTSTMWGLWFFSIDQDNAEVVVEIERMLDAMDMWADLDFEAMRTTLSEIDKDVLPDTFVRLCWTMEGIASINLYEDSRVTLSLFREATRGGGVMSPVSFLYLADVYSNTGELKKALSSVDRFEKDFGLDAACQNLRGYAYEMSGDMGRAWEFYLASLDLDPQDGWSLYGIASIVTDDQAEAFNQRYALLEDVESWFQVMLQTAEEENDIDRLKRITAAHRLAYPDDPMLEDAEDILLELQGN